MSARGLARSPATSARKSAWSAAPAQALPNSKRINSVVIIECPACASASARDAPGHRSATEPNRKTCRRKRRSRFFRLAADVMAVVEDEIFRPMRARLGHLEDGGDKGIICGCKFKRFNFHIRAFGQLCSRRQNHQAILDFSSNAHGCLLPSIGLKSKPPLMPQTTR